MSKSRDAFRTISEVAEWLDTPAHVLRFWESKFTQIKPVKRAGGRRYYRPDDMELLSGIKTLLHDQGMTIKGAQKLLREQGVKHVSSLGKPVDAADEVVAAPTSAPTPAAEPATSRVVEPPETQQPVETAPKAEPQDIAPTTPTTLEEPQLDSRQIDMFAAEDSSEESNVVALKPTHKAAKSGPASVPADPADDDYAPPARFFRVFRGVKHDKLKAQADRVRPLITRLDAVHARISADITE